ncbi:hypothetical protein CC80DRAFT_543747 [Byssothecium circinans]|uniref:Uncharacterized protein n=1 Tax=Byssothecium circinans TaxID=147558 RepID=A0A6A5UC83_9PLEO|nr:hypothetical protein CC80DRAFT_543747 [Byssothecium circinans]
MASFILRCILAFVIVMWSIRVCIKVVAFATVQAQEHLWVSFWYAMRMPWRYALEMTHRLPLYDLGPWLPAALGRHGLSLHAMGRVSAALQRLGPSLHAALERVRPWISAVTEQLGLWLSVTLKRLGPWLSAALEQLEPWLSAALDRQGLSLHAQEEEAIERYTNMAMVPFVVMVVVSPILSELALGLSCLAYAVQKVFLKATRNPIQLLLVTTMTVCLVVFADA